MGAYLDLSKIILGIYASEKGAKTSLDRRIEEVVSLIKVKVSELSIREAAEKLTAHLNDIRQGIIDFYRENKVTADQYRQNRVKYEQTQIAAKYPNLAQKTADAYRIQEQIFETIMQASGFENYSQLPAQSNQVEFDLFIQKIENAPLRHMAEASAQLEFCSIVADLIQKGELVVSKAKIKELTEFTDDKVCSYGGYAMLLELWEPAEDDNSRLARKIELMASIYSVDYSRGYKLTEDGTKVPLRA